jgi:hypothetical protein
MGDTMKKLILIIAILCISTPALSVEPIDFSKSYALSTAIQAVVSAGGAAAASGVSEACADVTNFTTIGAYSISASGGVCHGENWYESKAYSKTSTGGPDHFAKATVTYGGIGDYAGVIVRSDGTHFYRMGFNGGYLEIKRDDGTMISSVNHSIASGTYDIKLEVSGTGATVTLKTYVTDMNTPLETVTDTSAGRLTAGDYIGLIFYRNTGADNTADNLTNQ